ncbi:MAG: DNA mismatch repair endonuclease MutL [Prevotella sp.]|nr:DNA mismatch repair endonuclease MutL [Prevotella sp.]
MSDVIQLLPDSVANQIAAGEVIQRPASVIKELVENAVDAGAKTINVLVVDAGRTSIQVIDDGCGMSETDARLAFERHATSKIRKADDLFALHTMGFRGEALASIAAVAQVELRTRREGDDVGTLLNIAASHVVGQEPVSCPVGSNFKIDNLFYNVPARRKFLKSNATELNNIMTAFERIVLVYPGISFTLHHNGAELLNLRAGNLHQRIADIFGKRFNQDLLPVDVTTAICRITGFVGKPESARKKGAQEYFFVNGRYMRHPYFHKAVANAYERLVLTGMQVPYFIYFDVNPADIDVNIHPVKTEIKFENEQAIWQILSAAVKDAIGRFCEVPSIDFDQQGSPDIPLFDPTGNVAPPSPQYNRDYNPFRSQSHKTAVPADWEQLYDGLRTQPQQPELFEPAQAWSGADGEPLADNAPLLEDKSPAHYQYKGKYIMTTVKSGLMIIDQHRADERILYERYMEQLRSHTASTQRVLFPEVVQFAPSDAVLLSKLLPELTAVGFDLSDLGQFSYAVNGVPAGIEGLSPVQLLRDIVSDARETPVDAADELSRSLAQSMARHAAIPYGQILSNDEMESVVNELFACSNVNYTADGKPIIAILPQRDIERLLQ